jgi:predicted nucleic acid-binding protein
VTKKTLSVLRAFACPVKFRKAEILAKQIETEAIPSVTTRAVVLEIGNALARLRYRVAAIDLLDSLEQDPGVEIIPL